MDVYHRILLFCSSGEWTEWSYLHDTISLVWRAIWWSSDVEFVEYPQFVRIDTNALFFHEIQLHETQQTSLDIDWPIRIVCFRLQINQLSRNHSVKTKKFVKLQGSASCLSVWSRAFFHHSWTGAVAKRKRSWFAFRAAPPCQVVKLLWNFYLYDHSIGRSPFFQSFKSETLRHVSHQGTTHSVLLDDYLFLRSNIFVYDLTEKEMLCYVVNIVFFSDEYTSKHFLLTWNRMVLRVL